MLKLKELVDKIDLYDNAYYNDSKSLVSDPEYDGLKDSLRSLSSSFITKKDKNKEEILLEERIHDALSRVGAPPPTDGKWPKYY
jgi:NAD-dependent DNA ligase